MCSLCFQKFLKNNFEKQEPNRLLAFSVFFVFFRIKKNRESNTFSVFFR